MERKKPIVRSSLVLVAIAAGGIWLWRTRTPNESALGPPSAAAQAGEAHDPAPRPDAMPQPALRGTNTGPEIAGSDAPPAAPPSRRPMIRVPKLSSAERQSLGEQALIGQQAWNTHIAPLLYPPGHPAEGTYLDSVTLDQVVDAQLHYYEEIIPGGADYLDKPRLHIQKSFNYKELNERRRSWDSTDLRSTREFYDWMVAQPEDPAGRWGDIWLDADPADKDATTRRALIEERIRTREAPNFEKR